MYNPLTDDEQRRLRQLADRWMRRGYGPRGEREKFKLTADEASYVWALRHRIERANPGMSDLFIMLRQADNNCGVCGVHGDDMDHGPC